MLDRPPSARERRRARRAARQRRWRQRRRDHKMAVTVEVDDLGIEWLIKTVRVLSEADADKPHEVGAAISRSIKMSSRA
jgi:hypothetical protein